MSIICYAEISGPIDREKLLEGLSQLPERLRERILSYKDGHERQLRLQGQMLIMNILKEFGLECKYSLEDLKYTAYNRPYIDSAVDFNISHSGNLVVCAGIMNGKVGVDIEQLRDIDIEQLKDEFCEAEWVRILNHASPGSESYRLWTRKEAVLKAAGKGMLGQASTIDTTAGVVMYEGETYYLHEVFVKEGYIVSVASNKPDEQIRVVNSIKAKDIN